MNAVKSLILLGELVLVYSVLFVVLWGVAKKRRDCTQARIIVVSLTISLSTVASQALFMDRVQWFAVVPALAVVALMLYDYSWSYFWKSLLIVIVFSWVSTFGILSLEARARRAEDSLSAGGGPDAKEVVRYQQMAGQLNFGTGAEPHRGPPRRQAPREPARREAEPTVESPAVSKVTAYVGNEAVTPRAETRWPEARDRIPVGGIIALQNDRYVALIDGRIVEPNRVVSVEFEGLVYRWRIRSVTSKGIGWQPLDVVAAR